jgi:hypothetical protein
MRDLVQGAVQLRLREEKSHAGERQKQLNREAAQHRVEAHRAEIDAHDPGERDGHDADIETGEATDDDGDKQRAKGEPRQIHAVCAFVRRDWSRTAG